MVEVMGRSEDVAASVKVRKLGVALANEMVRWTALSAAATSTRDEWKQRGWLQKVSIFAAMQDGDKTT